jgi:hypothetical protein
LYHFHQAAYPLDFTPRKFVLHPESATLILIETDHNAYTEDTKQSRKLQMAEEMREAAGEDEQVSDHCQVIGAGPTLLISVYLNGMSGFRLTFHGCIPWVGSRKTA